MAKKNVISMQFRAREEDYEPAYSFVESLLERTDINKEVASETRLVFEALFQRLLDSDLGEDTVLEISGVKRIGDLGIRVAFEGKLFDPYADGEDCIEGKLLRAHDDKLDCSYREGYNVVTISVRRSFRKSLFACFISALCAIAVYAILCVFVDESGRYALYEGYVFPLESLYANAVLMVGAPMTFFSLLKNLTDTYVVSQRNSRIRRLQKKTIVTSIAAILLAFVAGLVWSALFASFEGIDNIYEGTGFERSFADIVSSFVPSSIFEPFELLSPIPLVIVALIVTYGLCSVGKSFDTLRRAMEACYALCSRMLRLVIALLPVFCFFAFMDVLIDTGMWTIPQIMVYFVIMVLSLLLLFASYAIRMRVRGIHVISFTRRLIPLIRENFKIGSAIDAVPFNIRYCTRTFKMNRERLNEDLPVLAQVNLDGNCFIIMFIALVFVFVTGTDVTWVNLIGVAVLVLLMSFGAPNQPGGILIAALLITTYLHSYDMVCVAIYVEALFGSVLNIVNVIGDIVVVAIEERTDPDSRALL